MNEDCNGCIYIDNLNRGYEPCPYCKRYGYSDHYEAKPEARIIDLSSMVGSGIDMEFSDTNWKHCVIGILHNIADKGFKYQVLGDSHYQQCRIRHNHWHHWTISKNPLPEGLEGVVKLTNGEIRPLSDGMNWKCSPGVNVIAFMVTGTKDGFKYDCEI